MPSKKYYEKNKEKIKEQRKESDKRYAQSEKGKETRQKYKQSEKGKEQVKKIQEEYRLTEAGKKSFRISGWKQMKVNCDDWDELYEYYKNCWECENCGVELIEGNYGNNKRCLDHCHITGKFRNVLCHYCNVLRGE